MSILPHEDLLMGRPRDYNCGNGQRRVLSGTTWTRLYSLFCLFLLLALFFVPLAHQCHLHTLEGLHPPLASVLGKPVGLQLNVPEPEDSDHHHHDAATCPICQAALSSRYLAVTTFSLAPALSLPVQQFCDNAITPLVANPDVLVLGPRAPPASL
ncbi:MAG: DUF2946 family protein [Desulfobaccales bacterium]